MEHTFNFFLSLEAHEAGIISETRSWFGTYKDAFNGAWEFSERAGYTFDNA